MADEEQSKPRRRGRRGGGRPKSQATPIDPIQQEPEIPAAASGDVSAGGASPGEEPGRGRRQRREPTSNASADVNPMDFWRSGRARSHRTESIAMQGQKRSIKYRLQHMYFPPWLPVAFIIVVVFGILGLLFVTRSATGAPRIGQDHWHASYTIYICGEKQPNAPTWESGVHTHGDGIMHIHPFQTFEEGSGARMVKWFEYGGGLLTQDQIREPGFSKTWKNGDTCPDGTPDSGKAGTLQVFVNGKKLDDWSRYLPHDGDRIQLIFGPQQQLVQLDDRQVLDDTEVTRTIEISITGDEQSVSFTPSAPVVQVGETVKLLVHNKTTLSQGLRVAGPDGQFGTADDFVAVPVGSDPKTSSGGDYILAGQDGFVVVRFDNAGQIKFQDSVSDVGANASGNIIVEGASSSSATPAPSGAPGDQTAAVTITDGKFDPGTIAITAGKSFTINLTNNGSFVHNLRIDGPDHQFGTDDDIVSPDITTAGGTGSTPANTLDAGAYQFRDDFNPTTMTGTLTVQ